MACSEWKGPFQFFLASCLKPCLQLIPNYVLQTEEMGSPQWKPMATDMRMIESDRGRKGAKTERGDKEKK